MSAPTLFGVSTYIEADTQRKWIYLLTNNWLALMGRPPRLLEVDLKDLAPLFANGISAKSIKSRIYALPEADAETKALPQEVVLIVENSALITPEGRILLDVLLKLQHHDRNDIDTEQQLFALSTATSLRSEWHSRWLRNQFESSISAPVLGACLFLLVNGSIGESRALLMPSNNQRDRELGAVIIPLVAGFSKALGGRSPAADAGVRQHWAFSQLSRLLGRDIARGKTKEGTTIWVRADREKHLINELAARLDQVADAARRQTAVADFIANYRHARGSLAALGQMHEDPTATRRIAARLLVAGDVS